MVNRGAYRRKTRCSGKCPCAFCLQLGVACRFTAPYRRGRPPAVEENEHSHIADMNSASGPHINFLPDSQTPDSNEATHHSVLIDAGVSQGQGNPRILRNGRDIDDATEQAQTFDSEAVPGSNPNVSRAQTSVIQSSRNSPEPLQTDRQGHIVGPHQVYLFYLESKGVLPAKRLTMHLPPQYSPSETYHFLRRMNHSSSYRLKMKQNYFLIGTLTSLRRRTAFFTGALWSSG